MFSEGKASGVRCFLRCFAGVSDCFFAFGGCLSVFLPPKELRTMRFPSFHIKVFRNVITMFTRKTKHTKQYIRAISCGFQKGVQKGLQTDMDKENLVSEFSR